MTSEPTDYRDKLLQDPEFAKEALKGELIMAVTEEICRVLEEQNLSRQDLADKLGKSKGYVSQLLNGTRNMTLNTIAEILHALNCHFTFSLVDTDSAVAVDPQRSIGPDRAAADGNFPH